MSCIIFANTILQKMARQRHGGLDRDIKQRSPECQQEDIPVSSSPFQNRDLQLHDGG